MIFFITSGPGLVVSVSDYGARGPNISLLWQMIWLSETPVL